MNLSIIIPLFNEEDLIIDVLKEIENVKFLSFVNSYEIIIIDDCSADDSYKVIEAYIKDKPLFRLYKQVKNMGKGASVHYGISLSKGDMILIQDADNELSPKDINSLLAAMNDLKVEFINGSRYLHGIIRPLYSYKRYLANKFFTFLTSLLINVKLTDMACGYKLIHKNLLSKLNLKEKRFGFEAELIIKALRIKKNNIAEVPVHYFPRNKGEGKKLRRLDGIKVLWTIFKYGLLRLK